MTPAEYCLRWNNYEPTFRAFLSDLYDSDNLVDVSLVSKEGEIIGAHKVVLSACSSYFQKIFQGIPPNTTHPVVILRDISHEDLQTVLCFMYKGVIRVSQKRVNNILQIASSLQIKGLTGTTTFGDPAAGANAQSPEESDSNLNRKSANKSTGNEFHDSNGAAHEPKAIPRPPRLHSISGNRVPRPQSEPNRQLLEANNELQNPINDSGLNSDGLEFTGTFGDEQLMQALKPEFLEEEYDYDESSSLQDSFHSLGHDSSLMDTQMQSSPSGLFMTSNDSTHQGSSGGGRVLNARPKKRKVPTPSVVSSGGPPKLVSIEDADKRYRCNECGNEYEKYSHLNRHLLTHAAPRFQCDICLKLFVRNDVLRRHRIEVHNIRNQLQ